MKKILLFLFILMSMSKVSALSLAPNAKSSILIEASTGEVIYSNNEND